MKKIGFIIFIAAVWSLSLFALAQPEPALAQPARIGLVNWAVPAEEVLPSAQDYVRELAMRSSPASMAAMKRQVYRDLNQTLGQAQSEAVELMKESFKRPDFQEGVKSFLERRPPEFPRYSRA